MMTPEVQDIIRKIKTEFRLAMNGVASASMREKGLAYKVNFGIELPRLRSIASEFGKNHDVAQELWKEDVRESKIIATMLQPVETFYEEIADIWIERMTTFEVADIACMNLFQHLPYAASKAFLWISSDDEMSQYCGWTTLARIFISQPGINERAEAELIDQLTAALQDDSANIQRAALLCAKKFVAIGVPECHNLRRAIGFMKTSEKQQLQIVYNQIFGM